MNDRCPGACNAANRRAARDADPDAPTPALRWTAGDPVWCVRDATAIRHCLTQLSDLAALLAADVAGQRGPAGEDAKVTTSRGHPSPSPAVDTLDEILRCLEDHEATYRRRRRLPDAPQRMAELRVDLAVAFLLRHLDGALAVVAADAGVQLGRDIVRLHRLARAHTHSDEARRRMPVPCPRCDLKSLSYRAGDTYVSCESCGRLMLLGEYHDHVADLARRSA